MDCVWVAAEVKELLIGRCFEVKTDVVAFHVY
jgi:hypothetical protein